MEEADIGVAHQRDRNKAGGRPTRAEAVRREARLLAVATNLFLTHGYDGTSMDAIAAGSGTGKPSLYARYGDKDGLFIAVLRHKVALWAEPFGHLGPSPKGRLSLDDLEPQLVRIGQHVVECSITPEAVALGRVLATQAGRFPDLAAIIQNAGWGSIVRHVAALLRHAIDFDRSAVADAELAADLFLSLVLGRLSRQALLGVEIDRSAIEGRVAAAVKIFLGIGLLPREAMPRSSGTEAGSAFQST